MTITIRPRKIRVNNLLARKDIVLEVFHEGKPNVSLAERKEVLAAKYI